MANPPRTGARTVVAIDFGTTYTGVAHALVKGSQQPKFEDATLFQAWFPANSPKVPSEISFSPSRSGLAQWGHSIDPDTPPVRYAKLELQARGRQVELEKLADVIKGLQLMARFRADQGAGARNEVPQFLTLSAEDIVTEFLDRVVRRWHNEMQSENEALLAANPLDLVITHPGEWTYEARNKTVRAVLAAFPLARFPTRRLVSLCSEPEASALYTSMSANREMRARLYPGDCFVICDAGGGTVDLLTFELLSQKPFKIVPITKAKSLHCGANSIDKRFIAFVGRVLGGLDAESRRVGTGGHDVLGQTANTLFRHFSDAKYAFDETDTADIVLPSECRNNVLPDPWARAKVVNGMLRLTREDLEEIFGPTVDEITTNLARQVAQAELTGVGGIRKKVTHIFMAGGFSENPYLFKKVRDWAMMTRIEVERGSETWGAVALGAVLKGIGVGAALPPVVKVSPRHYGIVCDHTYQSHLDHDHAELDNNRLTDETMARRQVMWMVRKGDLLVPGEPVVRDLEVAAEFKGSDESAGKRCRISFVASESDNPATQLLGLGPEAEIIDLTFKFSDIPISARETRRRANSLFLTYYKAVLKATVTVAERVKIDITVGSIAGGSAKDLEKAGVIALDSKETSL